MTRIDHMLEGAVIIMTSSPSRGPQGKVIQSTDQGPTGPASRLRAARDLYHVAWHRGGKQAVKGAAQRRSNGRHAL